MAIGGYSNVVTAIFRFQAPCMSGIEQVHQLFFGTLAVQ